MNAGGAGADLCVMGRVSVGVTKLQFCSMLGIPVFTKRSTREHYPPPPPYNAGAIFFDIE